MDDGPRLTPDEAVTFHRERVTMELYVSITLMAGLLYANEGWEEGRIIGLVWGTTLGLAAAHWFAFSLASRLVDPERDRRLVLRELKAQLSGAAIVAGVTTAAVLVASDDHQRVAAQIAVVGLVGYVVVRLGRSYGQSWARCVRSAVVAVLVAALVASVKEGLIE